MPLPDLTLFDVVVFTDDSRALVTVVPTAITLLPSFFAELTAAAALPGISKNSSSILCSLMSAAVTGLKVP